MKTLKFAEPLPNLVLSGEKDTTWRVNDDKELKLGDILSLVRMDSREEFSQAEIIWVKETTFGNLTDEDWEGHEKFKSDEEMYLIYSKYYSIDVTSKTRLKIIKFKLI